MVFITAREGRTLAGGRGNLRENREDPAPTVGIDGGDIKTIAPNKRRGTPRRYGLREF